MAWTESDIAKLKSAIAQGVTRVRYADRDVQYMSLEEMKDVLGMMQVEVDRAAGVKRTKQTRFTTRKGW